MVATDLADSCLYLESGFRANLANMNVDKSFDYLRKLEGEIRARMVVVSSFRMRHKLASGRNTGEDGSGLHF